MEDEHIYLEVALYGKREEKTPQRILIHGLSPSSWVVIPENIQVKKVVKKHSQVGSDPRSLPGSYNPISHAE